MTVVVLVYNPSAVPEFDKLLPGLSKGWKKSLLLDRSTLNGTVRGACNHN